MWVAGVVVTMGPLLLLGTGTGWMGESAAGPWVRCGATDVILRRTVAVKLLRRELAQHEEDLARFRAEARSAASVPHSDEMFARDFAAAWNKGHEPRPVRPPLIRRPGRPFNGRPGRSETEK